MQPIILHKPTSTFFSRKFLLPLLPKEWLVCPEAHFSSFQADFSTFWGAEAEAGKGDGISWGFTKEARREENRRLRPGMTGHFRNTA